MRWVLSGVLLAAGTALAVDYLNTPVRAWLQYHAPVPGAGGKSVAQIAAEQSAAPQAKIDEETIAPAKAKEREALIEQGDEQIRQSIASLGDTAYFAKGPIQYRPIDAHLGIALEHGATVPTTEQLNDPDYGHAAQDFVATPRLLAANTAVTPFMMNGGKAWATTREPNSGEGWVWFKLDDSNYGVMRQRDINKLSRVRPEDSADDFYEDIGSMGLGDRQVAVLHKQLYLHIPEDGRWKPSIWKNCTEVRKTLSDGPSEPNHKTFACDSDGTGYRAGRCTVHAVISTEKPSPEG